MAKTIGQLTELAATPDSTDILPIEDSGVTKKISVSNLAAATLGIAGNKTVAEGTNLVLGTTTGTKIGTGTNQLLGFYNATPVDQPALTADLLDSLQEVGLIASGAGDTPLNLTAGALGCGTITLADAANVVVNTTTGTKIGTGATQKIGFYNATPVVQPAAVADLAVTFTANAPAAADGSITVADGNSPTVAELLEYCVELEAKLEDLLGKLRTLGLIAT
jgi:hypothetical protein